jgi:hypothetical protein
MKTSVIIFRVYFIKYNLYITLGGAVVPGLVDGHTHPVWAGDRVAEFAMKLAGATYMQVSSFSPLNTGQLLSTPT